MWLFFLPFSLALPTIFVNNSLEPNLFPEAAEKLQNAMNLSADPCEDFFEFACGNWVANNPIPPYLTHFSTFKKAGEIIQQELKDLYESDEISSSQAINKLRLVYKKCMDEEDINKRGVGHILKEIEELGWFPILEGNKWDEEKFELTELMSQATRRRRMGLIFSMLPRLDIKNTTRWLLSLEQSYSLTYHHEYFKDPVKYSKQMDAFRQNLVQKTKMLSIDGGLPFNETRIKEKVDDVLNFVSRLAQIVIPIEDLRRDAGMTYNERNFDELYSLAPIIDWRKFFRTITPESVHGYIENRTIIVSSSLFFTQMNEVLNSTSAEVLANYVFFRYMTSFHTELPTKYDQLGQDYAKVMYGRMEKTPRWKNCLEEANLIKYASSAIFVRKHFDQETGNATQEMIADLQAAFYEMLKENEWMDEETKAYAEVKAKGMGNLVGHSEFILDDGKLDEYYQELDILSNDTYSKMKAKLIRFHHFRNYENLLKPVDRLEFSVPSTSANAFYSNERNTILMPAAVLRTPFFDKHYPKALNYGGIGSIIGHEITHGFDDRGRQFDVDGNLRTWWDEVTAKNFKERAQCIIDQYGNITVLPTSQNINGRLTIGENIADNGGVKESFKAYKKYLAKHGREEERVPGFEQFDNHQLFYIGYAHIWCGLQRPESIVNYLLTEQHSPGKYRVNVVLSNQPEFAEAFKCPNDSPMNPNSRCCVW